MSLIDPTEKQYLQIKTWFNSHQEIYTWGGPKMTYPMSDENFLNLLKAPHLNSFCLMNESFINNNLIKGSLQNANQEIVAFGQYYKRLGRHHLCRLAVSPDFRGQGFSKSLITQLLEQAAKIHPNTDASLFVFKGNIVAYNCYKSLGFVETKYPEALFPSNMQSCVYMVFSASPQN